MTTNVYIDGFNMYYGCLKGTPYKWLDLDALCQILLPRHDIKRIRYFTARVSARPNDPQQDARQDTYLRALYTLPKVSVHLGNFKVTHVRMALVDPSPNGPRTAKVIKTEEKGSDVNLATYMTLDACRDDCSTSVIISNDSDLCEPLRIIREELGIKTGVINPHASHRRSRSMTSTFFKQIRPNALAKAQLPLEIMDPNGQVIRKPENW